MRRCKTQRAITRKWFALFAHWFDLTPASPRPRGQNPRPHQSNRTNTDLKRSKTTLESLIACPTPLLRQATLSSLPLGCRMRTRVTHFYVAVWRVWRQEMRLSRSNPISFDSGRWRLGNCGIWGDNVRRWGSIIWHRKMGKSLVRRFGQLLLIFIALWFIATSFNLIQYYWST